MPQSSRQKRILLVMGNRYIQRIHHGVAEYAGTRHWHLTNLFGDDPNLVRDRECDGIIAALGEDDLLGDAVLQRRKPTVSASIARLRLKIPHITGDNEAMGRSAAQHFLDRGFRRFIWYAETTEPSAARRLLGYREALREQGINCETLISPEAFPSGPPRWRELAAWIQRTLRRGHLPCAVYAFNDSHAVNLLDAAMAANLRVPGEVAVLGTDNHPLVCPTAAVPLSSVNHDLDELGRRAGEELARLMAGGQRERKIIEIPHRGITVRQSSDVFAINEPEVVRALQFIHNHSHKSIAVEQIVAATTLTRRSLERRFQTHLQLSILGKLHQARFDRACTLLRDSELPIIEIAQRCGYTTPEYFHRIFRRHRQMTPLQYRGKFRSGS